MDYKLLLVLAFVHLSTGAASTYKKCEGDDGELFCAALRYEDIPRIASDKLKTFTMFNSSIHMLTKQFIQNFPNLEFFNAINSINILSEDCFKDSKLTWVSMPKNKLTGIDETILKDTAITSFDVSENKELKLYGGRYFLISDELKFLNMKSCNIKRIYTDNFAKLPELMEINLAGNMLTTLPPDAFDRNTNLYSLDLSNNKFTTLTSKPFLKLTHVEVKFHKNPWKCDMMLHPLINWLKSHQSVHDVKCEKPKGLTWEDDDLFWMWNNVMTSYE